MLASFWAGFLIFCVILGVIDLWVSYGAKIKRFIQKLKPLPKPPKPLKPKFKHISIKVVIDPKTQKAKILLKFDKKVDFIDCYSKIGADMDCPIKTANAMANLLGLKPDGKNSWSKLFVPA